MGHACRMQGRIVPLRPPMTRPHRIDPRHASMRLRIACAAARLMAEDGIDDYSLAKRKAARQLGAPDSTSLPTNEEIEAALRDYLDVYQADAQPARLQQLRQQALAAMRWMAAFRPYLTGPVLDGTAGPHSPIRLQLYTDSAKDVEIFLLNSGNAFDHAPLAAGRDAREAAFSLDWRGALLCLDVYSLTQERNHPKGRGAQRARTADVEALLAAPLSCEP